MRVSVSVVLSRGSVVVSEAQWISLGLSGGPWGSLGTVRLSWLSAQCIYTPFMTKSSLSTWSWLRAQTVRRLFLYDFDTLHEVHILHIFKEISWMWWSLPYVWSNMEFMFGNNYVKLDIPRQPVSKFQLPIFLLCDWNSEESNKTGLLISLNSRLN